MSARFQLENCWARLGTFIAGLGLSWKIPAQIHHLKVMFPSCGAPMHSKFMVMALTMSFDEIPAVIWHVFYLDFKKNEDRYNIQTAVENLKIPFLVVHGDSDNSVLPNEGNNLHSWNKNSELIVIKNGNHTFSSKHPWESKKLPKELKAVTDASICFIKSCV